jgi:hypothetical protein
MLGHSRPYIASMNDVAHLAELERERKNQEAQREQS